jgi:hypothetical protein
LVQSGCWWCGGETQLRGGWEYIGGWVQADCLLSASKARV